MSQLPIQNLPVAAGQPIPSMAINPEGLLFMAQIIEGGQVALRLSQDRGGFWEGFIPVPNATSSKAPSIAFVNNQLYVAWTSSDDTHTLYYTFSEDYGRSFQPVIQVSDVVTLDTPVLTGGAFASISFKQEGDRVGMVVLP